MTTTSTISIDRDELAAARAVVLAVGPAENDATQGVALVTAGGARRWLAWAGGAIACTAPFGATASTGSTVLLSRRMVEFASTLAEEGEAVELHLHDGSASVVTDTLNLWFDAPAPRPVPQLIGRLDRGGDGRLARAVIAAGALFRLLAMGRALPIGIDLDEVDAPRFRLDVTDGELTGSVDWTPAGAPAALFSTAADTTGAGGTWVSPASAAHVVGFCDADDLVSVTIPADTGWLEVACDAWVARIAADPVDDHGAGASTVDGDVDVDQWRLFDPDDLVDPIHVEGSLRPDPLAGASLTDVRAFAMDPDPQSRMLAAASRWNWDAGIQLTLADDPDVRVLLALLDDVDPGVEAARVIIHGPHVAARRVLAGRNMPSELLVELAGDPDPVTRDLATQTLARRGHQSDSDAMMSISGSRVNGDRLGGGLEPDDRETHYVMPGTSHTVCAEPIVESWELVEPDTNLIVSCGQCGTQPYWLPAAGRLDRDAVLAKAVEPWPRGVRKHVTGDDDPARGWTHRPESTSELAEHIWEQSASKRPFDPQSIVVRKNP